MKSAIVTAAVLILLSVTALSQTVDTRRMVTVAGEASAYLIPDRAVVSIGVQTEGLSIQELKATNDKRTRAILDAVSALGIATKDIQTDRLTIEPIYDYRDGRQELLRYRMSNIVTIHIKDLTKVENVVNAGIAGGSNLLNGLVFESSKEEHTRDSLRIEATKDARRRANDMAVAAGARLGRVVSLQENSSYRPRMYEQVSYMKAMGGAADSDTPVQSGELNIRFSVSAVFELE